ncbi:MerR family transcriptional regulator [Mesobacillus harenae]|uniref:MerR family transcriptional regulator n=1 Tax=Mesobacillus harenae TaxID=2213203 RepID=UPI0015801908|nr:MerR family transcriptional regulator [Mesobacillus harenae]
MNSSEAAQLLGVSASTIQRWVKQLGLPMEKNERGHYIFNTHDIGLLREIQEQVKNGGLQELAAAAERPVRKGVIQAQSTDFVMMKKIQIRMEDIERSLNEKANDVVSYQVLQHRQEIEELQKLVESLSSRVQILETKLADKQPKSPAINEEPIILDQPTPLKRTKKKNIIHMLFK